MNRISFPERVIVTGLGSGYSPIAPATAGSAVFCLIFWFVPSALTWPGILLILPAFFAGVWLSSRAENEFGHDGGPIVIDELIGQWITLIAVPHTYTGFVVGFFLFRLLDIWKPLGIRSSQKAPAGWGVMLDDLLAGILGAVILLIARLFFDETFQSLLR